MNKTLYAVVSDKRGVLYVGEDKEARDEAWKGVGDEEISTEYDIQRGHDRLFIQEVVNSRRRDFNGKASVVLMLNEQVIQALKGLL